MQVAVYSVSSIMILGIAGGNGLEHIQKDKFEKIYGVDINSSYLQTVMQKIESWGYQVSVLPKMSGEPDHAGLMRYYLESAGLVLILEDQDGGMYCFYYGFDQYISERIYTENMQLLPVSQYDEKKYEDVLKTVRLKFKREVEKHLEK